MSRASRPSDVDEAIVCHVGGERTTGTAALRSHLHRTSMSSAGAVADEPRGFSTTFAMRNFSIPIPHPITWAVSAFMARLRKIDEIMALHDSDRNALAQPGQGAATGPQRQPFQQTPVPWTFLTSGYFIGFLTFVRVLSHQTTGKLNPMPVTGSRLEQDSRHSQSTTARTAST